MIDELAIRHGQNLSQQAERADRLARTRRCPHCHERIALLDAISMVRGHGYVYYVRIRLADGERVLVKESEFSPQMMLWDDPEQDARLDSPSQAGHPGTPASLT